MLVVILSLNFGLSPTQSYTPTCKVMIVLTYKHIVSHQMQDS